MSARQPEMIVTAGGRMVAPPPWGVSDDEVTMLNDFERDLENDGFDEDTIDEQLATFWDALEEDYAYDSWASQSSPAVVEEWDPLERVVAARPKGDPWNRSSVSDYNGYSSTYGAGGGTYRRNPGYRGYSKPKKAKAAAKPVTVTFVAARPRVEALFGA